MSVRSGCWKIGLHLLEQADERQLLDGATRKYQTTESRVRKSWQRISILGQDAAQGHWAQSLPMLCLFRWLLDIGSRSFLNLNIFFRTGLPLASSKWVRSTFSSHPPLSSKQHIWLATATYIIFSSEQNSGMLGTEPGAVRSGSKFANHCATLHPSRWRLHSYAGLIGTWLKSFIKSKEEQTKLERYRCFIIHQKPGHPCRFINFFDRLIKRKAATFVYEHLEDRGVSHNFLLTSPIFQVLVII